MLKRLAYSICFIVCALSASAQTMEWLCEPQYDDIKVLNEHLYLVAKDGRYGILDESGTLIHDLKYDRITAFQEGRALLLKKGKLGINILCGIIGEDGRLIRSLEGLGYLASFDYPYYKEGKMVYVKETNEVPSFKFGYLDQNGKEYIPAKYLYAAPFIDGRATVRMASSGSFGIINSSGSTAVFTDKPLFFLSSVVDGNAVGWRNSRNGGELVMLRLKGDSFSTVKVLAEGYGELRFPNGNYSQVSYGNHTFTFDAALRYVGQNSVVENAPVVLPELPEAGSTVLSVTTDGTLRGVAYNGSQVLLPQFVKVIALREKIAAAECLSGEYGLLKLNEHSSLSFAETLRDFEFRSGTQPELSWRMDVNGVSPDRISVRMRSEKTGLEHVLYCVTDDYGYNKIVLPFEFKSGQTDLRISEDFNAVISVNGLETSSERLRVSYMHHELLKGVNVSAPEYTGSDGYADITVTVTAADVLTSSGKAQVRLSGGESRTVSLSGRKTGSATFRVNVPEEEIRTFTFYMTVSDGTCCPSSSASTSVTIKNYYLQ